MSNIALTVKLTVDEFFLKDVTNQLLVLHKATHENDKGCIQYDLHKVVDDENSFMLIEKWEDADSLEEHKLKDHFLNFVKNTEGKIKTIDANILNKI